MMKIKVIKNKKEFKEAQDFITKLDKDKDKDDFELLSLLMNIYENRRIKANLIDPITLINEIVEKENLMQSDLKIIGSQGVVSEILNYKRKLSLNMIRNIHKEFNIPLECLIKEY